MPRVLTYDEMCNLCADQWVWIEVKDHPVGYTDGLYYLQLNRYVSKYRLDGVDECLAISTRELHGSVLFDTSEEGWRIWSDKPTEDEMNNTEWDYSTWSAMHRCIDCANFNAKDYTCCDGGEGMRLTAHYAKSYGFCGRFKLLEKEH